MDKKLNRRSLHNRREDYAEEGEVDEETGASQDNMSYQHRSKSSEDSGRSGLPSYRETHARNLSDSSVQPASSGTTEVIATSKHGLIETKMVFSSLRKMARGCARLVTINGIILTFMALLQHQI
jgi:hypothetical protein